MKLATFLLLGLLAASVPLRSSAQVEDVAIVPTITTSVGLFNYAFELQNTGTDTIGKFDLGVPDNADLTSLTAPAGWLVIYTTGFESLEFDSTDASTDIQPGKSLAGFNFSSPLAPGAEAYAVMSFDTGNAAYGTTAGPVPEPSTWCLLVLTAGAFACRYRAGRLVSPASAAL